MGLLVKLHDGFLNMRIKVWSRGRRRALCTKIHYNDNVGDRELVTTLKCLGFDQDTRWSCSKCPKLKYRIE